ncbi:hypothetical protein HZS_7346, partial [Henneguya salminicola]
LSSEWINLTVSDFLQKWYESLNQPFYKIHKITLNQNNSLFALYKGYCMFINAKHKSNNQTLKIDNEFITFNVLTKKISVPSSNFISENTLNLLLKDHGKALVTKIIKQVDDGVECVTQTSNICFEAPCSPLLQGAYRQKLNESPTNYKHVVSTINQEIKHTHTGAAISVGKVDLKMINNFCFHVQNIIANNISDTTIQILIRVINLNYNVISNILVAETWLTTEQKKLITLIELFFEFYTQIVCYSDGIYYQYAEDIYIPNTIETLFEGIKHTLIKQNHSKQLIDTLCPIYNSLNSTHTKNKLLSYIHPYNQEVYISRKLSYDVNFDQDVSLVQNFMVSIFPEQCVYKIMMQILANALIPIEPPRSLFNLYGSGANGKSAFVRLVIQTFEHMGSLTY